MINPDALTSKTNNCLSTEACQTECYKSEAFPTECHGKLDQKLGWGLKEWAHSTVHCVQITPTYHTSPVTLFGLTDFYDIHECLNGRSCSKWNNCNNDRWYLTDDRWQMADDRWLMTDWWLMINDWLMPNNWWLMTNDNDRWQCLMTMTEDNDWWQWLMTGTDDNDSWQ